jgi:hypothetical protein
MRDDAVTLEADIHDDAPLFYPEDYTGANLPLYWTLVIVLLSQPTLYCIFGQ